MKAIASSIQEKKQKFAASCVLDKNPATRWSSEFSDPQWIYIDAGKPIPFNLITLCWETAYAKVYEIQISNDALNWKTVYRQEKGSGGKETIYLGNQKARYVRMYGIKRATEWGYSLYKFDLQLCEDNKTPAPPKNLTAVLAEKEVFLNWDDNTEVDLVGYNLYRSKSRKGSFKKINRYIISHSYYKDKDITTDIIYYYIVKAVDYSGNESLASNLCAVRLSKPATASTRKRNYFTVPACAFKRYLGDIPNKCASSSPNRGIALGGFGAGSFMYNLSGSFGPWALNVPWYHERWLSQGAFHIYEKANNCTPKVRCLSTDKNLKKSWCKLKVGEGKYFALQPKGWTTYNCFTTDISSIFYSPIIAHNYKETSYPVAVWKWRFYNPEDKEVDISVMFTWCQPPFGNQIRKGYKNSYISRDNICGVVLKSSHPDNTVETQNTEWCLATKEDKNLEVSYVISWNKDGDGQDIWNDFKKDGRLSNRRLDNSDSAAALSFRIKLKPYEKRIVPIVLSWDYPVVKFGDAPDRNTQWWKKYTQYFGRNANNSFKIAQEALSNYSIWEKQIDEWMEPIINNSKYPDWLKCAAFNELYYNQFGGCFYEGGLKSGHKQEYLGKHTDDSKHFLMESMTYRFCNTFDVRHYSSIIYAKLWPEIEKDTLINWADAIMYFNVDHQTPHDAGSPNDDPYFKWDAYGTNKLRWKDLPSKFIQQCWRYYYLYKDKNFLRYVWPACKATYEYMKTTDTDKDCLPNNKGSDNTYDAWGLYGTSLLCGGLWVGALESMEKMAEIMDDPIIEEVRAWLNKAKPELHKQLWHEKGGYYKIDTESRYPTAIMADGLNGQRYCEAYGLDDILPKPNIKSHLLQVYKRNVLPLHDFTGDGIGKCGAINGIKEDGSLIGSKEQAEEIWVGSTYFLAASMYHAGLKDEALKTAFGAYYLTYEQESTAYWFNTPEAWHNKGLDPRPVHPEQYQRPRAVWELIFEIDEPFKKR